MSPPQWPRHATSHFPSCLRFSLLPLGSVLGLVCPDGSIWEEGPRVGAHVEQKYLYKAVNHQSCILPTLEDITPKLAGAKMYSTLDTFPGFWQNSLDAVSQKLTIFITMGTFFYRWLPFRIMSTPVIVQTKMSTLWKAHDGVVVIVGDTCLWSNKNSAKQPSWSCADALKDIGL